MQEILSMKIIIKTPEMRSSRILCSNCPPHKARSLFLSDQGL